MVKLKGSTVIEMAYLMPVVLLCWMAVIFALFYYHDKNIIGGAAYETAIVGSEEWRWQKEIEDGKMEQYFQKRIENKLIFFDTVSVETAVVKDEFEVTAGAQKRKMRVSVKRSAALTVPEEKIRRKKVIAGDCRKGPGGMREEYERDLHHAWMILETDELYKEDYQMRMLMENAIPGLLSVRGQGKDDKKPVPLRDQWEDIREGKERKRALEICRSGKIYETVYPGALCSEELSAGRELSEPGSGTYLCIG